jgi:PAS domain S-box-containing protein
MVNSSGDGGNFELADIFDVPALQGLLDNLHVLTRLPLAVIDDKGKVLAGVGWQDICSGFHRAHPETCRNCVASDTQLSAGIAAGEFRLYKCRNNLWDIATPLIVNGKQVGNLFSGQFIFADEEPDRAYFKAQAARYGFPEEDYLAALERVPRPSREHVEATMKFFVGLAQSLSQASWTNITLARAVEERERAAEVLRASERRLARTQNIAHLGTWELDAATLRMSWSDEMYRIFGLGTEEFAGTYQAFLSAVHPDHRGALEAEHFESVHARRDHHEGDYRIVRPSGEVRIVHGKCEHVRDGSGRVVRSAGVIQDITEIKKREAELSQVNRALRARSRCDQALTRAADETEFLGEVCTILMEDCGHAMLWIGYAEQDELKTVRPAACAGYAAGYLETLNVTWADKPRGREPTGTAIRTGKPSLCRNMLTDPKFKPWRQQALERGYASALGLPLRADGKTFGALSVYSKNPNAFSDEEVKLLSGQADDLAFSIGALRMRSARKAAEVRFQQAQKMEAVGLLAGGIAHDFNNILATIVGYNSLLLAGLKGNRLRDYSLEIQHSSEMAALLTQQLLGVSGNRGAQRRVLDPNSLIMAMAKMLRRLVGEKIRIDLKLHRHAWPLTMDSGQLEQIVMNLAVNARDAMPKGGRLILTTRNLLVKAHRAPKAGPLPGRYVVIEVRDNGCGMDAAVQARIFEPIFTTKGPGRGTGLGLATVKSIVEEYGGHITVESKPGRRTVFRVLLPSVRSGVRDRASGGRIKKSLLGHETILVVEDNGSLISVIELTLRRAGYTVFSARTAEEAVSRCGKISKNIDLLLTDVVLPDMDGPALAKRLKEQRPGMRTVYMSGYPGNALGPIAGFGGCVLLEKPFTPREMLSAVRRVLDIDQGDLF